MSQKEPCEPYVYQPDAAKSVYDKAWTISGPGGDRRQKLETSLLSKDDRIDELQAEIAGLEKVIESKDAELARQAASLKDSRAECAELAAANMALARQCDDLKVQIESARRRAAAILGFVKDLVGDLQEWKITHAADGSAVPGR